MIVINLCGAAYMLIHKRTLDTYLRIEEKSNRKRKSKKLQTDTSYMSKAIEHSGGDNDKPIINSTVYL